MRTLWALVFKAVIVAAMCFASVLVQAHDGGTTGYAAITVERNVVRYALTLSAMPADTLARYRSAGAPATQAVVDSESRLLAEVIALRLRLHNNGDPCEPAPRLSAVQNQNSVSVTASVDFVCRNKVLNLKIRDDLFDLLGEDLHTLATIEWSDGKQPFAFGPDAREITVAVSSAGPTAKSKLSATAGAGSFFPLGVEHILTGYDHLLFLLALIICGGSLIQILKIVTAFTVAHSVTLALAALDVLVFSSQWVEALIALSIAYVAAENLWPRYALSRRWTISFIFGAVHGFGFATLLREAGIADSNLLWALLNFNLGVELGQALVVLLVLPILIFLRRQQWQQRFAKTISIGLLVIGLVLFAERAFLG